MEHDKDLEAVLAEVPEEVARAAVEPISQESTWVPADAPEPDLDSEY